MDFYELQKCDYKKEHDMCHCASNIKDEEKKFVGL